MKNANTYRLLLTLLALCLYGYNYAQSRTMCGSGRVIEVRDGDTFRVLFGNSVLLVRLAGTDAPEFNQAFGLAARQFAYEHMMDSTLQMCFETEGRGTIRTDRYGRAIGNIQLRSGEWLDVALISRGLAWLYRQYPSRVQRATDRIERVARESKRGLWVCRNVVAPWAYRRMPDSQKSAYANCD